MTRDEVIEECAVRLNAMGFCASAQEVRALQSKPPEKSPEVASTLDEMLRERGELLARLDGVEAERDHYRAALAAQEKRAEEALARVKHMEWVMDGAKMQGET